MDAGDLQQYAPVLLADPKGDKVTLSKHIVLPATVVEKAADCLSVENWPHSANIKKLYSSFTTSSFAIAERFKQLPSVTDQNF